MMEKKKLTKKERDFAELNYHVYVTAVGRRTIPALIKEFGLPKGIVEYATIEARTGLTTYPTITVDRFMDCKLVFRNDIVINGISRTMLNMFDLDGIESVRVMKGDYNPGKMPKATMAEIHHHEKIVASRNHNG